MPVPAERDLAAAWEGRSGTLALLGGERVRVVYPGRRNPDAGPDFLDAILETKDGEVRGAVELHRRTSDWERHGHGADPRYAGVVLHVVGRDDGAAARRPGGGTLPLLELAAAQDEAAGQDRLRFPCAAAVHAGRDLVPTLEGAGEARFRANAVRLREALAAAADDAAREQVAHEALAEALGYSRNSEPLRVLAQALPLSLVGSRQFAVGRPPAAPAGPGQDELPTAYCLLPTGAGSGAAGLEALFLGAAGLLPSQRHLRLARRRDAYVEVLERRWAAAQDAGQRTVLRAYAWGMGRVRPENAPVRRVVALAHLALRWPERGLLAALREAFGPRQKADVRAASRRLATLVSLPCPPGYWALHWDFGVPVRTASPDADDGELGDGAALVGPSRAADVVVNVLLRLAAALGELEGDGALATAAGAVYAAHPLLAENWITRLVRERAALPPAGPVRTARAQQGLIAIYEGPCRDLRCADCQLARAKD